MKKLLQISLPALFALCPLFAFADREPEVHNFHTLTSLGKIEFKNDNKTGVTDLLTYACTGGAVFGPDYFNGDGSKKISINFGSTGAMVTTTAVDSVERVIVQYYYDSKKPPVLEFRLSRDSVHWTEPIEPTLSSPGSYEFNFVAGRYYIRLTNKNSYKASINLVSYRFGWCNCFLYIPE